MINVDCPMGMLVHGSMDGIQVPLWKSFDKCYWEYDFSMVYDLLDDNVCLVLLQSFDDASTMELFFFT